jgi:hypothetical protein
VGLVEAENQAPNTMVAVSFVGDLNAHRQCLWGNASWCGYLRGRYLGPEVDL